MNLRPVADGLVFPEGPVVLADGSVLVVEVLGGRLTRIDSDGTKTVVAQTGGGPNGAAIGPDGRCWITNNGGALDSLAVDRAGNICVASPGKGAILVFKPQGGELERIATADFLTTNIAFGGSELSTAYITLGATGRLVTMSWPRPGLRLNYQETR